RPVEFESSTEMGFSAAELLAALPEVYTESLRWMSSDLWEASPEAGVGQLELRLRYSGEPILLREPVQDETGGPTSTEQMPLIEQAPQETLADDDDTTSEGDLAAADCRSLQINVQLEVRSAGGALNEVLEVPLLATSAAGGRFSATITVEQLQGALDVVWPMPREPMQWSGLQLSGELTPTGTQGTLVATFTGDMVSTGL